MRAVNTRHLSRSICRGLAFAVLLSCSSSAKVEPGGKGGAAGSGTGGSGRAGMGGGTDGAPNGSGGEGEHGGARGGAPGNAGALGSTAGGAERGGASGQAGHGGGSAGQGGQSGVATGGASGQAAGRGGDGGVGGATGDWQGTRQFGSTSPDYAAGLAVTSSGALYVTAMTYNGAFDGNAPIGSDDILLIKLDPAGNKQWSRELGTDKADDPRGGAVDRDGNVFLTGHTVGGLDGHANLGDSDLFLFKFDAQGNELWSTQLGTSEADLVANVVVDKSGFVYVAGNTFGALDPGHTPDTADTCFLAKLNGAGTVQWIRQFGSQTCGYMANLTTDAEGHVYVMGSVNPTGSDTNSDLFIAKFDDQGAMSWARTFGSDQPESAYGVATDSAGNVYIAGDTLGGLDGNVSAGDADAFLVKYDGAGARQWTRQVGTPRSDVAHAVVVDAAGGVYVAGTTEGGMDGNANRGLTDLFLIKYDGAGTKQWVRQLGTSGYDNPSDMDLDPSDGVFIAGTTTGSLDGNKNVGTWDFFVTKYTATGSIARQ